jgi:hypothetical protein
MHSFNYDKFLKEGVAITKDGELKVIKTTILSTGHMHLTFRFINKMGSIALISHNYNKFGRPVDSNYMPLSNSSHLFLVNE